jgi:hypothetical protein
MQIIAMFAVCVVMLNAIAIAICSIVERYSEYASLIAFLAMFVGNFVIAWKIALYLTERYLLTDAQREENERRAREMRSPYGAYRA